MAQIANGVYPTMITPYTKQNQVDYRAVADLANWYIDRDCDGIFAVCQSSELFYLSLKERVEIAQTVVQTAKQTGKGTSVVVSGHIGNSIEEQTEELIAMHRTGADGVVLISNRLDPNNDGDAVWIKNAEHLLSRLPSDIKLGIYECPKPYKRLLTPEIIDWCIKSGRFVFIKDTCCNIDTLNRRLQQLKGSGIKLFNANTQTLLHTLKNGASGYSGVMANFHPDLYVWLCRNFEAQPEKAKLLQAYLTMYAFSEHLHYPVTAKYHMQREGIAMELLSRSADQKGFNEYERHIMDQCILFEQYVRKQLNLS